MNSRSGDDGGGVHSVVRGLIESPLYTENAEVCGGRAGELSES